MATPKRVGLIVPSSNTTMETEVPALFRARETVRPERFTFHAARMRMLHVDPASLQRMHTEATRASELLSDAAVDAQAYACLVAIMSRGPGAHREAAAQLSSVAAAPVVSSAGALVEALHHLGARRIAMLCPYAPPLADLVIAYLAAEGIEVADHRALNVTDNRAVGALDPLNPTRLWTQLDLTGVDAIVASACVQMPSLASVPIIQEASGLPTLSAAVATTWRLLGALDLDPVVPGAGALLDPLEN